MDVARSLTLLALCGAVLVPVSPAHAACEVSVSSNAYTPATKTVTPGTTVEWCWTQGTHTVTFDAGPPNSGVQTAPSGKFSRTFDAAGTFGYFCDVHGAESMSGSITVGSTTSPTPTKTPSRPPATSTRPAPPPTTRPATTAPATPSPTTATPTTAAPTSAPPSSAAATTAPATPSTSPAALDIDPAPAKPKTGLALAIGLVVAAAAFGTAGWLLLRGRSG